MHEGNLGDRILEPNRILTLYVVIIFSDASHSIVLPVFPFYAMYLGASLGMIGILAAVLFSRRCYSQYQWACFFTG